jgi:hypothetical protein
VTDNGDDFLDETWFLGAHVTNLHRIKKIAKWIDDSMEGLKTTLEKCRPCNRGPAKEAANITKEQDSRMVSASILADYDNNVQAPRNFTNTKLDEQSKLEIMRANDYIHDGVILVNHCHFDSIISGKWTERSTKPLLVV